MGQLMPDTTSMSARRRGWTFLASLFAALALLLCAPIGSPAQAQRRRQHVVSPAEQRARELYERGDEAYANGRYDEAISAFQEAYSLSARPLLLYNLANAQERAGYLEPAVASLERYLPDASASERVEVQNRIAAMRERIEQARAEAAAEAEAAAAAAQQDETITPVPITPEPAGPDLVPAIVTLAGGGALLAVAVVTGVLALSARDEYAASCSSGPSPTLCTADAASALDTDFALSVTTDVVGGLGIVALGLGVYFLVDALTGQSSGTVDQALVVDPRRGEVGVRF